MLTDHLRPLSDHSKGFGRRVFLALVFLLTLPPLAEKPGVGIDPSWKLGMHLVRDHSLVLGRDLFFTYGPWGFLSVPLTLARSLWIEAVGFSLLVHLTLFTALGVWAYRRLEGWAGYVAPLALILFAPAPEYHPLLALLLGVYLAVSCGLGRRLWWATLIGVGGSAMLMMKFSAGTAAAMMIAGGVVAALCLGRRTVALALAAGFGIGAVAWGVIALGSLRALGRYLSISLQIAASHNDALQRTGPLWQPWLMIAAVCLMVVGIERSFRGQREQLRELLPLLLPGAGLLILACKHGFGRQETHVFYAFSIGSTLMTWICLELRNREGILGRGLCLAGASTLAVGTFILSPPTRFLDLPGVPLARAMELVRAAKEMSDPEHRSRLREDLRRQLPLAENVRNAIEGRTVDVLTTEIALVEAWGLRWTPRQILQSYVVTTVALDRLDAVWFSGPSAPERLLIDLQGVDTRHPFMDSPLAWRQIFLRYEPIEQDQRWLVLGRRDHPREVVVTPLQRFIAPFNQPVPVPKPITGHLEMQAILTPSFLGRLASFPWVVPEVRVGFVSPTHQPLRRILAPTAMNSFPVIDPWPNSPAELRSAFIDPLPPPPQGVGFVTQNAWAWKSEVDVTFFQVGWSSNRTGADDSGMAPHPGQPKAEDPK